jgi:2,3-dihydroxybenzoate decarboxylase
VAERLDVPLYLHPSMPLTEVRRAYYDDYAKEFPTVVGPAWGFTAETATQAIRLILSRVFDTHPNLKIVLGHLGEGLPFLVWRINQALARPGQKPLAFHEIFRRNFYLTTSGNFSTPALLCSMLEMGMDHIMFSVDYPYVSNKDAIDWVATLQMASEDRAKLLGLNAQRLFKL